MGVPGKTVGTMFTPVPVEIVCQEAERVGGKIITQYFTELEVTWHLASKIITSLFATMCVEDAFCESNPG